jgi:hypothetical protein
MDDTPTDAELDEWLSQLDRIKRIDLRSGGRLDEGLDRWQRTIRALQDARECIAELETEIADMRGNARKDLLARLRGG